MLVDDSPVNLQKASQAGIAAATIVHPWNAEMVESGRAVGGRDWRELRERVEPLLRRA